MLKNQGDEMKCAACNKEIEDKRALRIPAEKKMPTGTVTIDGQDKEATLIFPVYLCKTCAYPYMYGANSFKGTATNMHWTRTAR